MLKNGKSELNDDILQEEVQSMIVNDYGGWLNGQKSNGITHDWYNSVPVRFLISLPLSHAYYLYGNMKNCLFTICLDSPSCASTILVPLFTV